MLAREAARRLHRPAAASVRRIATNAPTAIAIGRRRRQLKGSTDGGHVSIQGSRTASSSLPSRRIESLRVIPVSYSERGTCPPACAFYEAGCYAEVGKDGAHWRSVPSRGLSWDQFLDKIRALPIGQLWRHNEAGDLAGRGDRIDFFKLAQLALANRGRRGFTFTHKPITPDAVVAFRAAIDLDFTINASADSLDEADQKASLGVPVVCVTTSTGYSPAGRKLVPCPAQTHSMTCAECQLCAQSQRKAIITFAPHGQSAALIPELVRRKRSRDTAHA